MLSRPGPEPTRTTQYGTEPDQLVDWYVPTEETDQPLVVFIHGGYWRPEYDRAHARTAAGGLAAAGFTTALIEYRRVPGHPDLMVDDVAAAIRHCVEQAGTGGAVLVGHSAGGHLALLAAADASLPITGTVALAPLADLVDADRQGLDDGAARAFLGTLAAERPDLDPIRSPSPARPVVLLHGEQDSVVPLGMSETYAEHHGAELHVISDSGHFEFIDPESSVWVRFLSQLRGITAPGGIE